MVEEYEIDIERAKRILGNMPDLSHLEPLTPKLDEVESKELKRLLENVSEVCLFQRDHSTDDHFLIYCDLLKKPCILFDAECPFIARPSL